MHIRHLKQELIISVKKKDFRKVKRFLRTLRVGEENEEQIECLLLHKNHGEIFVIETKDNEQIIITLGEKEIQVFLKKNKSFEKLKKKFFNYFKEQ